MMQNPRPTGLPMRHRRRPAALGDTGQLVIERTGAVPPPTRSVTVRRAAGALLPLLAIALVLHTLLNGPWAPPEEHPTVRPPAEGAVNGDGASNPGALPASGDEEAVTAFRVPASGHTAAEEAGDGGLTVCMPTVARGNGTVEYVSNAAKSWWLAHAGRPPPLRVFDMDAGADGVPVPPRAWLRAVGAGAGGWLRTARLSGAARAPRRRTFGDSAARVAWRSKEAQDYAAVLRACAGAARGAGRAAVLVVQDDVLFGPGFGAAAAWARDALREGARTRVNREGVLAPVRVCSASLFDIGGQADEPLSSSNLVARAWRVDDALRVADYFDRRFDHAPVDWLADHWCRKHHAQVAVLRPNPVRHRGQVSSFSGNERDSTLT